jgi:hypothetical protein
LADHRQLVQHCRTYFKAFNLGEIRGKLLEARSGDIEHKMSTLLVFGRDHILR